MEKQNNKLWITRLESLEAPLSDSNALWERLHARTAKNRKTKAAYWYAAAASVIIFSGILFIPAKKEELPVAVTTREKPQAPVVKKVIEHPVQPNENNLTSKVKTTKNKKPAAYARITIKKQVPQISCASVLIQKVGHHPLLIPPSPSRFPSIQLCIFCHAIFGPARLTSKPALGHAKEIGFEFG